MFDKVSLIASSILNFTTLFLVIMKVFFITGEEGKKHNALWNILTGVKLSTAGAAVQVSVSFPALFFYWLKSKWTGRASLPGVLLRL